MEPTELQHHVPLFSGCSTQEWQAIERIMAGQYVEPGEIVFKQGEPCSAFYAVVRGMLKLRLEEAGIRRVVGFVQAGDTFGESAVFSGEGYAVSAVAVTDCELLAIPAFPFLRLTQQFPNLALRMLGWISQRYHAHLRNSTRLAMHNADQRVAAWLLHHAAAGPTGPSVTLPPKRVDLANLLCITPETLCRIMKRLRTQGHVAVEGDEVRLLNTDALQTLIAGAKDKAAPADKGVRGAAAPRPPHATGTKKTGDS
jgi:CRP-like cAMP-binding protein